MPVQVKDETKEAVRRVIDETLSADNPDVQEVISYAAEFLESNPRQIKRFVNLFRFFVMIHTERRLLQLPAPTSLKALAKLAVLGTRWPALITVLTETAPGQPGKTVLQLLEQTPTEDDAKLQGELGQFGVTEATHRLLLAPELRSFLRSEPRVATHIEGYF
jgi:hypothetical protein